MKPYRSAAYLAAVRGLGCVICGAPASAHHSRAGCGMGQKAGDHHAYPLCRNHHQDGTDAVHRLGRRAWEQRFGLESTFIALTLTRLHWSEDDFPPDPE